MKEFTFKTLVKKAQHRCPSMRDYDVRYRVEKYRLGRKIAARFCLYTDKDVRKVLGLTKK